jgi:hypothetical protein
VRRGLRGGGRGLGVVALAEVLVGLRAAPLAQPVARGVQEQRVLDLGAAALAEELGLDRVERVDVGAFERLGVGPVLRVPQVDALQVGVDVP